jgi:RNA polymerase sigma factor (sigma-70 family)
MILETQLIAGCLQQNRADQKLLYKTMYNFTMGICLRYTGNAKDASEVMNTGFLKVFTDLYKRNEPFKDWIGRIMIDACIDHFKNNPENIPLINSVEAVQDMKDHALSDQKLTKDEMMQMVQQLSPMPRIVFNLVAIDGYAYNEVAILLGIKILAVNSNLVEARLQLKRMITLKSNIKS